MNSKQANWASQHDWFIRSRRTPYGTFIIQCMCEQVDAQGKWSRDWKEFADFEEMKAWAGY